MVQYLTRFLREFKDDERGAFSLFMIVIFTTMVLIGGAAIDLARYETVRSSIQYNLDRAVLAAASMRQTQAPVTVVNDYMSKVDTLTTYSVAMDTANTSVTLTGRHVSATATAVLSTYFLKIAGIDTINVVAASQASEEIPNLEISLVLDVSGSMYGSKISSLKTAANTFVDTVIIPDDNSLTAISIVPYSTNVSVPQSMWDLYTTEGLTTNSRCMIFPDADFATAAIDTGTTQRQLPYYSYSGSFQSGLNYNDCKTSAYAEIMPFSTSVAALQSKINSLVATGSTATHIGTKWGTALLDPAARPVATNIGGEVAGLPADYAEPGVLKIMVVMTDGQNTTHYDLYDHYRSGPSDMYYVTGTVTTSEQNVLVCNPSWVKPYFVAYGWYADYCEYEEDTVTTDSSGYYIYRPDNGKYYKVSNGHSLGTQFTTLPGNPSATVGSAGYQRQMPWSEVWENISSGGYAKTIGKQWYDIEQRYATASQADTDMLASCSAAKSHGVVVYTIAFSAPTHAKNLLKGCATSLSNYYNASTTNIASVFSSIAVSIQKLKLTQ